MAQKQLEKTNLIYRFTNTGCGILSAVLTSKGCRKLTVDSYVVKSYFHQLRTLYARELRMQLIKRILFSTFIIFISFYVLSSEKNKYIIKDISPQEGVFILGNGYSSTVIELYNGKFRYWFSSDLKTGEEPSYPLNGEYTINGNTVYLSHDQISKYQNKWTFRKMNSTVTLWRDVAIEYYENKKGIDPYGILRLTSKTAEQVLSDKHH